PRSQSPRFSLALSDPAVLGDGRTARTVNAGRAIDPDRRLKGRSLCPAEEASRAALSHPSWRRESGTRPGRTRRGIGGAAETSQFKSRILEVREFWCNSG